MRNRLIALLAGLMVLSIAGAALAAPSVDTTLELEYDSAAMKLIYTVDDLDLLTPPATEVEIDLSLLEDFTFNHGQILKIWKQSLRDNGWEGGWGCLIRHFAGSTIGQKGADGAVGDFGPELFEASCSKKDSDALSPGKDKQDTRTDKGKPPWAKGPKTP